MLTLRKIVLSALVPLMALLFTACGGSRSVANPEPKSQSFKQLMLQALIEDQAGRAGTAAEYYRSAYTLKPRDQSILYRAAELFIQIKDYRKAAEAFQFMEKNPDEYPLLGLQYGRALKQDGRYEAAKRELALFLETYNGADRPIVSEIVRNELAGIRLAQESVGRQTTVDIDRPGRGINTGADEIGPVAVAGDQLFFTSTAGGQSRLYQSRFQARQWTKATVPPGFPVIAEGEFGTGSISPDGRVFYFTICSGLTGEDATNRCEIFRGERTTNGNWTQPEALPSPINLAGANNAFPHVTFDDGRELLFFSSDREGGRGGMDLYLTSRQLNTNVAGFSAPTNLGAVINTVSNEVSPFYVVEEEQLYFASDGHPGFGGLDIFRAKGSGTRWSPPENPGQPINSSADDAGLTIDETTGVGYLHSNRTFAGGKESTRENDIFSLNFRAGRARLKATIYDNTTGAELGGAEVSLLELTDGKTQLLERRVFPTGVYTYDLRPGRRYRVEIRREGYQGVEYAVETSATGSSLYGQPVFLRRSTQGLTPVRPEEPSPAPPPNTAPNALPLPTSPAPASAPAVSPLSYRIQISAQREFREEDEKYDPVRSMGDIRAEDIPNNVLKRITVGDFPSESAARSALQKIRAAGFSSAFAVRYRNGRREGQVNL
jgi:peptidoglycan-associated lipoprotein